MPWVKPDRYKQRAPKYEIVILIQAAQGWLLLGESDKAQQFLEEAQELLIAYQNKSMERW